MLAAVDPADLDEGGRRVLELALRDFRRAGVDRDDDVRARLRELAERETAVGQEFSKNIRDGVRVDPGRRPSALDGLPAGLRRRATRPTRTAWSTITTDYPDALPFLTFAPRPPRRAATLDARVPQPRLARRTTRCSPSCSRCATSTPRCSATTTGRPTTPRSR